MIRRKTGNFAVACNDARFRVKELKHLVKKVDSSMAKQLVKRMDKSSTDMCKDASHLDDIIRQMRV
jgi:hypothetical protein